MSNIFSALFNIRQNQEKKGEITTFQIVVFILALIIAGFGYMIATSPTGSAWGIFLIIIAVLMMLAAYKW